jgi:hypothetical protein
VTILVMVLGVVVPVAALVLEWYLPLPYRWWGLILFVSSYWLSALVG